MINRIALTRIYSMISISFLSTSVNEISIQRWGEKIFTNRKSRIRVYMKLVMIMVLE
jgi:hypothetical protein